MEKLRLDKVSLIAADCAQPDRTLLAMRHCLDQASFLNAFLFTHRRIALPASSVASIRHIPIPHMESHDDYSRFLLWDLSVYVPLFAEYILIVQHDGFIINPDAWSEEFLEYDYIGAPWGDGCVGNGGFSLRSKRLLEAVGAMREEFTDPCPEDVALCRTYRTALEQRFGIRFAPQEVARRFSVENETYQGSFGYHGHVTQRINGISLDAITKQKQQPPTAKATADRETVVAISRIPEKTATDSLSRAFEDAAATGSDINEHLHTLTRLGQECIHITDFGARRGVSTLAFLHARPNRLIAYNRHRESGMERVEQLARELESDFLFRQEDVLLANIEETDLLFLDTHHSYGQVRAELLRHASRARRYLVFHDTATFGDQGEGGERGIWPAVQEFLEDSDAWELAEKYEHNNGLTVLRRKRKEDEVPSVPVRVDDPTKEAILTEAILGQKVTSSPISGGTDSAIMLHVITAVTRPGNLPRIRESLEASLQRSSVPIALSWHLVVDRNHASLSADQEQYLNDLPNTLWYICGDVSQGSRGAPQKNHALEQIQKPGFVWFLDDDNLCHPDFLSALAEAIRDNPNSVGFIFAQSFLNGSPRLSARPDMVRECGIDTAQFIVHRDTIGKERLDPYPHEDGRFIQRLYRREPERFVFIDRYLTYHNAI